MGFCDVDSEIIKAALRLVEEEIKVVRGRISPAGTKYAQPRVKRSGTLRWRHVLYFYSPPACG